MPRYLPPPRRGREEWTERHGEAAAAATNVDYVVFGAQAVAEERAAFKDADAVILPADDEGHGFLTTVGGDERVKMSLVGFNVVGDLHGRAVGPENGEWKKGAQGCFQVRSDDGCDATL